MKRVSLCCNSHRNGVFAGRLRAVEFTLFRVSFYLACAYADWSPFIEIDMPSETLSGHGFFGLRKKRDSQSVEVFQFERCVHWYGNWCWDAVDMEDAEANRVVSVARAAGLVHARIRGDAGV